MGAQAMHELTAWMDAEHQSQPIMHEIDWDSWDVVATLQDPEVGQQQIDAVEAAVGNFFMTHTKQELYEGSIARRILLAPISDVRDIMTDKQLHDRHYFVTLNHAELETPLQYPGPFGKLTETPLQITRRAPHLGEHHQAIYVDELGLTPSDIIALTELGGHQRSPPTGPTNARTSAAAGDRHSRPVTPNVRAPTHVLATLCRAPSR